MILESVKAGLDVGANIGEGLAKGMTNYGFHYKKSAYEEKIDELSGSVDRLQECLTELTALKGQMSDFWKDEIGENTRQRLEETIGNVQKQMQTTQDLIVAIRGAIGALDDTKEELYQRAEEVAEMFKVFDI